jgi:ribonuclease HI
MKFKGKLVYVETDSKGQPILEDGRARMRYSRDGTQIYRPSPKNLTDLDEPDRDPADGDPTGPTTPKGAVQPGLLLGDDVANEGIIAYTDGACIGNPGPAGLGYVINFPDGLRIERGEPLGEATNNIAELTAIRRVLELVDNRATPITIFTDSEYSIGVLTRGWKVKANQELVYQIKRLLAEFGTVNLRKVKGHAGIPENEVVDSLARQAAENQAEIDGLD